MSSTVVDISGCPSVESAINEDFLGVTRAAEMSHLYFLFAEEADKHVYEDRYDVIQETGPVIDLESCHKSSHQHEEDVAWSQNGTPEQDSLRG